MKSKTIGVIISLTLLILGLSWYVKTYKLPPALLAFEQELIDSAGQRLCVSEMRGRYVLISYFQTWCADCIREIPSMEALQKTIGKDKLFIALVSDEESNKLKRFREKHAGTLPVYTTAGTLKEQGIHVFPTTYLLNEKGEVILSKLQGFDWNSEEVRKLIGN